MHRGDPQWRSQAERFSTYFENENIELVERGDLPEAVWEFFVGRHRQFTPPGGVDTSRLGEFQRVFLENGDIAYLASEEKQYDGSKESKEQCTYVYEARDGEKVGHGEIRWNDTSKDPFFVDKPFVGMTRTEEDFRREGLGLRRIKLMNAIAQMRYGKPLYSSTLMTREAKSVWGKLQEQGIAERFMEGDHERFVMQDHVAAQQSTPST